MDPMLLALLLFLVGLSLAFAATACMYFFQRKGTDLFDPRISTITLLLNPETYFRRPWAKVFQILGLTGYGLIIGAFICVLAERILS